MTAASTTFESPLPEGFTLEEFTIIRTIGEGGFSIVYLARDHTLECDVAIKEYLPGSVASRSSDMIVAARSAHYADTFKLGLDSFIKEAKILRVIEHPSVVKVYRFFERNGTAYMVMPFYKGQTLKKILQTRTTSVDEGWIKAMLEPILDALDNLHRQQCFHRDIAPDNIMVLENGTPLLIDFGAARRVVGDRTQALTVILKPGYAPIEQYAETSDLKQGAWTDIYALAGVFHYAVTGKAPKDSLSRALHDSQPKLAQTLEGQYSAAFLLAIDKALSVKPEDRFASANEFKRALGFEKTLQPEPMAAQDVDVTVMVKNKVMTTNPRRKFPTLFVGAAMILLSVGGWRYLSGVPEIAPPVVSPTPLVTASPAPTPAPLTATTSVPTPTPVPAAPALTPPPVAAAPEIKAKPTEPTEPKVKPEKKQKSEEKQAPEEIKKAIAPGPIQPDAPAAAAQPTPKEKKVPVTSSFDLSSPPLLAQGSFWVYQRSDVWLNEIARKTSEETRILAVQPNGYRVLLKSGGLGERERVLNKEGNQTYRVDGTSYVNQMYAWPMVIGKTWSIDRLYTSTKTSLKVAVKEQCKVAKNESVTVPAGQFKAVRIDCEGFETPQGQNALRVETSHWYAPEVQRFAKTSIKKWNDSTLTTSEVVVLTQFSLN